MQSTPKVQEILAAAGLQSLSGGFSLKIIKLLLFNSIFLYGHIKAALYSSREITLLLS